MWKVKPKSEIQKYENTYFMPEIHILVATFVDMSSIQYAAHGHF